MSQVPVFVVVGNVNQGKSSIVASLSEDPTIPMSPMPGTTTRSQEYVFEADSRPLFRIVDTPGFQEARAALAWMKERSVSAMDHPQVVRQFVDAHRDHPRFQDEVRLLQPILDGASVLYVVDVAAPPQPSNEAEMEILRWTGRPGMALLNQTQDRDHGAVWRPYLEQFFNVVRAYDAHSARFEDRVGLLRGFREVRADWQGPLDEAMAMMERERRRRRTRAASVVAEMMVRALTHVERHRLREGDEPDAVVKSKLEKDYQASLRQLETTARQEVEGLYGHQRLARDESEVSLVDADLFSDTSWQAFGLTPTQLARYGAAWGGVLGAGVDLMVGGLSFFTGALIGAAAGGAAGYFGGTKVARSFADGSKLARLLLPGESGRFLAMGPATNPRFAWMLLDRALVHHRVISDRSHARGDAVDLGTGPAGITATLDAGLRGTIDGVFRDLLKCVARGRGTSEPQSRLAALLVETI